MLLCSGHSAAAAGAALSEAYNGSPNTASMSRDELAIAADVAASPPLFTSSTSISLFSLIMLPILLMSLSLSLSFLLLAGSKTLKAACSEREK
jgi:hypothetical protein